jgi:hypothetical protein
MRHSSQDDVKDFALPRANPLSRSNVREIRRNSVPRLALLQ